MESFRLRDKVALITGASRGIGKQIALRLAREGATIIINYCSNEKSAIETAKELKKYKSGVSIYKANVADFDEVRAMFNFVLNKHKKIDFLINNAGVNNDKIFINSDSRDWYDTIGIDLLGTIHCCKSAILPMIRRNQGRIINIASVSAFRGKIGQTLYAAAKAGVIAFSRTLAKEVGRWGINVNVVVPGLIKTDMTRSLLEKRLGEELEKIPLRRIGDADDVAKVLSFLLSSEADYITGAVIVVDGGMSA